MESIFEYMQTYDFENLFICQDKALDCPGEIWAMIALKTYSELEAGKKFEEADICCHDKNTN